MYACPTGLNENGTSAFCTHNMCNMLFATARLAGWRVILLSQILDPRLSSSFRSGPFLSSRRIRVTLLQLLFRSHLPSLSQDLALLWPLDREPEIGGLRSKEDYENRSRMSHIHNDFGKPGLFPATDVATKIWTVVKTTVVNLSFIKALSHSSGPWTLHAIQPDKVEKECWFRMTHRKTLSYRVRHDLLEERKRWWWCINESQACLKHAQSKRRHEIFVWLWMMIQFPSLSPVNLNGRRTKKVPYVESFPLRLWALPRVAQSSLTSLQPSVVILDELLWLLSWQLDGTQELLTAPIHRRRLNKISCTHFHRSDRPPMGPKDR